MILAKLIEAKPEFEDENGKGIFLGKTRLYVKNGVIIALSVILVTIIVIIFRDPIDKMYQAFQEITVK